MSEKEISELVQRLRFYHDLIGEDERPIQPIARLLGDAADTIDQLQNRNPEYDEFGEC